MENFKLTNFFYHLALSEDIPNNNTKSQEKITLGPEVLIFLGAVIGMMILVVVIEKNCIVVPRLIII